MTRIHRIGVLLVAPVLFVLATVLPAQAKFVEPVTVPAADVATLTVEALGGVTTAGSTCGSNFNVRLAWTTSASRGVTGYSVTVYRADGSSSVIATGGTSMTSFSGTYLRGNQNYRFTVTTRTGYGWTAGSARTAPIYC